MMANILRITAAFFALSALPACSASPSKGAATCAFSRDVSLELHKTEDIEVSLPLGSKLTAENTIDARYWTWQTNVGRVSVTWIGGTARETREDDRETSCVLDGRNTRFKVYLHTQKVVAVSDALLKNGAGLLVEVESSNAERNLPVALAIIGSIQARAE